MRRPSRGSILLTLLALLAIVIGGAAPVAARQDAGSPVASPVEPGGSDWPMYRQNPARTASVDGPALVGQPVELWRLELGASAFRSPAVVDGILYLGREDGVMQALDAATGDERWSFQADAAVQITPSVVNGMVLFGSENGTMYAVDAASGEQRWQFAKPTSWFSLPVVADDVLYIGGQEEFLYAIDIVSGEEMWAFGAGTPLTRGAAVSNGMVFIGGDDGKLFAVNADDGTEAWRFEDAVFGQPTGTPTVGDGVVFFAQGGILHARDAVSGDEVWQAPLGEGAHAPVYAHGTVYTAGGDGVVYAIDGASGDVIWTFQSNNYFLATPAIVGDVVYAVNFGGFLYALDAATGTERWRFAIEGDVDVGPSYADGVLYVSTSFGILYAIGGDGSEATGTPAETVGQGEAPIPATAPASPVAAVENPVEFLWASEPIGFAVTVGIHPDGSIWVPDIENSVIHIVSPDDGTILEDWTDDRAGEGMNVTMAEAPIAVVVFADDGGFYAAYINGVIQQFDADRQFVRAWGGSGTEEGQIGEIGGLALDAEGNVYVTDVRQGNIKKFTPEGEFITSFGEQGSGPGQLYGPTAPGFDTEGNMYVADYRNQNISKFAPDGTFITSWGTEGSAPGQVNEPGSAVVDASGYIYFGEEENHRVQVWDADGQLVAVWGELGSGDGQFNHVATVTLDDQGNIYVNDVENHRVQKFKLLPPLGER